MSDTNLPSKNVTRWKCVGYCRHCRVDDDESTFSKEWGHFEKSDDGVWVRADSALAEIERLHRQSLELHQAGTEACSILAEITQALDNSRDDIAVRGFCSALLDLIPVPYRSVSGTAAEPISQTNSQTVEWPAGTQLDSTSVMWPAAESGQKQE